MARDNKKSDLLAWARFNVGTLARHDLFGTGTTGGMLMEELELDVKRLHARSLSRSQPGATTPGN